MQHGYLVAAFSVLSEFFHTYPANAMERQLLFSIYVMPRDYVSRHNDRFLVADGTRADVTLGNHHFPRDTARGVVFGANSMQCDKAGVLRCGTMALFICSRPETEYY